MKTALIVFAVNIVVFFLGAWIAKESFRRRLGGFLVKLENTYSNDARLGKTRALVEAPGIAVAVQEIARRFVIGR